ncbi:MAG: hypothetical protein WEB88_10590 [Gemmatimonadota bacterium]
MRTFQDTDFQIWETWVSSGEHGFSDRHPRILFRCRSAPLARARVMALAEGDESDAQRQVLEAGPEDLLAMLEKAQPVN